tara:strand:- start:4197 stop:5024 length:828 start_codon:yes stop_codon:yes gene_type:complete
MSGLQQRTPAWHVARRGKLTASNLGAALGQVSYVSRAAAYRRAMGVERFQGNEATQYGNDNEANGILAYQTLTGNLVQATGLHIHPHHDWLAGSPDGFVGTEGMIEVKCPFYFRKGGRLHKTVPPHYYMQVNALLEITGREWCDYVCWAPEGMVVYRVTRDPQVFDFLLTYYGQFYAAMQAQASNPPPLSRDEKDNIEYELGEAIDRSVDCTFWQSAVLGDPVPSSDPQDEDEDDASLSPPAKRMRLSNVSDGGGDDAGDGATPRGGKVAGGSPV